MLVVQNVLFDGGTTRDKPPDVTFLLRVADLPVFRIDEKRKENVNTAG